MRFIFQSDRWRSKGIICRKAEITLRQQGKQERSADPRKRDGMPRPLLLGEVASSKAKMTESFRNAAGFCAAPLKYQAPAPLSRLPATTLFHIFFTRSAIPFHNYRIQ